MAKARLAKEVDCFGAPHSALAVRDDLATRIEFMDACRKVAKRDQVPTDVADLVLMRLANVEDEDVLTGIQAAL